MRKKYTIKHSNTDVRKLWCLVSHGIFAKRTVEKIFEESCKVDDLIVFNSKQSYEKFKKFEYSYFAMYKK